MKRTINYITVGYSKFSERDDFEEGCDPDDAHSYGDTTTVHSAASPELLIEKLCNFLGAERDGVELDACDEDGRIDVCIHEREDGATATERDFEKWKRGELPLYYCTYTFVVLKAEIYKLVKE